MAAFPERYAHHAGVADYDGFLERLCTLGWWIGLAPLEDNAFNRCKADTKWVEYSYAGMAVVATRLPVYEEACGAGSGLLAGSADDWHDALDLLLRDGGRRRSQIDAARRHLNLHYDRLRLRQQVLALLDTLGVHRR